MGGSVFALVVHVDWTANSPRVVLAPTLLMVVCCVCCVGALPVSSGLRCFALLYGKMALMWVSCGSPWIGGFPPLFFVPRACQRAHFPATDTRDDGRWPVPPARLHAIVPTRTLIIVPFYHVNAGAGCPGARGGAHPYPGMPGGTPATVPHGLASRHGWSQVTAPPPPPRRSPSTTPSPPWGSWGEGGQNPLCARHGHRPPRPRWCGHAAVACGERHHGYTPCGERKGARFGSAPSTNTATY